MLCPACLYLGKRWLLCPWKYFWVCQKIKKWQKMRMGFARRSSALLYALIRRSAFLAFSLLRSSSLDFVRVIQLHLERGNERRRYFSEWLGVFLWTQNAFLAVSSSKVKSKENPWELLSKWWIPGKLDGLSTVKNVGEHWNAFSLEFDDNQKSAKFGFFSKLCSVPFTNPVNNVNSKYSIRLK